MYDKSPQYTPRNDAFPGEIYLLEAEGYHGILPGKLLRRCKIALSRDSLKRLDEFHSNQPPCNLRLIRRIYVSNMKLSEEWLHDRFKHCNVKLLKSKEWFDLYPWQFLMVQKSFNHLESRSNFTPQILFTRTVVGGLIAVVGVAMFFNQSIQSVSNQASPKVSTTPTPVVKHLIKMRR